MEKPMRSKCPLNYGLEFFGDKWSLLIIRDLMFFNKRTFNEFLKSDEGISTNILRDRLNTLEQNGLITRHADKEHKQKIVHNLTQKSIDLLPVLVEILFWSESQTNDLHPDRDKFFYNVKQDKEKGIEEIRKRLIINHLS